jgi:hypothetical protein
MFDARRAGCLKGDSSSTVQPILDLKSTIRPHLIGHSHRRPRLLRLLHGSGASRDRVAGDG